MEYLTTINPMCLML